MPSFAPFLHFYQEGIVPTANKRLDLHFVLNAVLGHSSTYKKVLKGAVWDWLESLLTSCDKCNVTLSKTVFASRMSNGMECRYCESANITALTTDSPAIQGFPLPEDVVASNFFAQFRGEGVWEKADNARQVLGVINADALPRDLGKIHNGKRLNVPPSPYNCHVRMHARTHASMHKYMHLYNHACPAARTCLYISMTLPLRL